MNKEAELRRFLENQKRFLAGSLSSTPSTSSPPLRRLASTRGFSISKTPRKLEHRDPHVQELLQHISPLQSAEPEVKSQSPFKDEPVHITSSIVTDVMHQIDEEVDRLSQLEPPARRNSVLLNSSAKVRPPSIEQKQSTQSSPAFVRRVSSHAPLIKLPLQAVATHSTSPIAPPQLTPRSPEPSLASTTHIARPVTPAESEISVSEILLSRSITRPNTRASNFASTTGSLNSLNSLSILESNSSLGLASIRHGWASSTERVRRRIERVRARPVQSARVRRAPTAVTQNRPFTAATIDHARHSKSSQSNDEVSSAPHFV